jgi:sugar lactone lactonase YvrE
LPRPNRRIGLTALAALLAGLACSPVSLGLVNPTPPSTPRPTRTPTPSPTPPPTPTPTPAPIVAGDLPERIENRPGGYTIHLPAGWAAVELSETMLAAASSLDALQAALEDPERLPDSYALVLIVSDAIGAFELSPPGADDPLDLLTVDQANLVDEARLEEPTTFEVDGYPAAGVEFAGRDADLGDVRGYVMGVVRADDKWGVRLIVVSPAHAWRIYAEAVEVMAEGMTFGDPTPAEPPPDGFLWQLQRRRGTEEGKFAELGGIAFGSDGSLYVADASWGVWVLSHEGAILDRVWLDDFEHPSDVDAAPDGRLYVADSLANTVWIVAPDGDLEGRLQVKDDPFGESSPRRLAAGPDGSVSVIDENVNSDGDDYVRVMHFESDGDLSWTVNLSAIQAHIESPSVAVGPEGEVYVVGQQGRGFILIAPDGEVLNPDVGNDVIYSVRARDIAAGPGGNVYLATWERGILQLGPLGEELGVYGVPVEGKGPYPRGGVYQPEGIAVGPDGVVYYDDWNADYAIVSALRFP